MNLLIDQVSVN